MFTNVGYGGMPLAESYDLMQKCADWRAVLKRRKQRDIPYMNRNFRFYRDSKTIGLSISEIGNAIRAAGYPPDTHRVFGWYSAFDSAISGRAFLGDDNLFTSLTYTQMVNFPDSDGHPSIQPFGIARLFGECSDIASVKCGYVHRTLFPNSKLKMHLAHKNM